MIEISAEKITTDDEQRQWHPERDQSKTVKAGYSNKLLNALEHLYRTTALNRMLSERLHKPLSSSKV